MSLGTHASCVPGCEGTSFNETDLFAPGHAGCVRTQERYIFKRRQSMWIRKAIRDHKKGVDSPMPTQAVSNEEFEPRPQTEKQKHVEHLIGELSAQRSKKLGMERRDFMRSSMGLATCFLASNLAYGKNYWDVDEIETWEPAPYDEKWPKSEYFIVDVQAHFTNGLALRFRDNEFMKNMGFNLKNDVESYSFKTFVKEMYFDSETSMVVISGVPTVETNKD